jgi:glycogen debranching enzyme
MTPGAEGSGEIAAPPERPAPRKRASRRATKKAATESAPTEQAAVEQAAPETAESASESGSASSGDTPDSGEPATAKKPARKRATSPRKRAGRSGVQAEQGSEAPAPASEAPASSAEGLPPGEEAETTDEAADAEPGKILHEMRQGEMALLGEVPFRHYYGSIDSTPLFVMLAGAYLERTDDLKTVRRLWPNILAALGWMDQSGDRDGDGFIEYGRRRDTGLINQGWKDSHDSIFHADGTLAHGPVALVEVQAYAFGAWRAAASIARRLGEDDAADGYADRASRLQQRFDDAFFDKALGTYVLALDGDKKPCRVRASNAGHALFTGIARPERAAAVVRTLTSNAFFSGWGVRTVAVGEARYNPMSYHNGSVWPHDNALIAAGFARYGFRREAARLFGGLFAAAAYIDLRRLPELFCGFPRERGHGPTFYPVACSPQAWAAATPLSLLQSCLGLRFDTARGSVAFDEPLLPDFLDDVTLQRLSLGDAAVDVALHRRGKDLSIEVLGRRGRLGVDLS